MVTNGVINAHGLRKSLDMVSQKSIRLIIHRVRKAKKEEQFDPQVVAAVEAKLRALGVEDDSLPPSEVENR